MILTKLTPHLKSLIPKSGTRLMSSMAPTFTSSGGGDQSIVTKLAPSSIATMIMTGKPVRPFPASYEVKLDEFTPAAISAVSVVTRAMVDGEWESLTGLVDDQCIREMKSIMALLSRDEKELSVVNSEDVFFSFISNPTNCSAGNDLHLVLFSLPQLGLMKSMTAKIKEKQKETDAAIREKVQELKGDKASLEENLKTLINDYKEEVSSSDPYTILKANEIIIGNYRMKRETSSHEWTVCEVAQMSSVKAWPTIFRMRWKGRLSIATRIGTDFNNILRYDYMTDYIAFLLFSLLLLAPTPNM